MGKKWSLSLRCFSGDFVLAPEQKRITVWHFFYAGLLPRRLFLYHFLPFHPCLFIISHLYLSMPPFTTGLAWLSKWTPEWREQCPWGWKDKWQNDSQNLECGQGTKEELLYFSLLACLWPPSNLRISQGF